MKTIASSVLSLLIASLSIASLSIASCRYDYNKLNGSSATGTGGLGGETGGAAGSRGGGAGNGAAGTGGSVGSGGVTGAGGSLTGTGGSIMGTGGSPTGTGGSPTGTGGSVTGTGGASPGTGGTTGTGGNAGGAGGQVCSCAAPLVCERTSPDCLDPSWAEWPMPNDPVDVAAGAPNPMSYTVNADGTVTDNVTKLMWQKAVSAFVYSWPDATAYCSSLRLGGYADWRLPTLIELDSIVDYGKTQPCIDATAFPSTPNARFWSATPLAVDATRAWFVFFYNGGGANTDPKTTTYDVRCVR